MANKRKKRAKKAAKKYVEVFMCVRATGKCTTAIEYIEEMITKQKQSEVHKNTCPIAFEDALYSTLVTP
jgi:hypothetical protein